jgi:hypothetical protein
VVSSIDSSSAALQFSACRSRVAMGAEFARMSIYRTG